jgi:transcriptional regulator with XRE-family HTH domain
MRRTPELGKWFCEVTAGETQEEVAARLGISQAWVSRLRRDTPPSPELLERIIREYSLDPAEARRAAGYEGEEPEEEWLTQIAAQTVKEVLRRAGMSTPTGAQRLVEGLRELNRKYGRPIPIDLAGGLADNRTLTVAQAEAILRDLEQQLEEGLI